MKNKNGISNNVKLVCFVALGDWGEKSTFRDRILIQITSHLDEINFIIVLGDNFYETVINVL